MSTQTPGTPRRPIEIRERVYVPAEHVVDPLAIIAELTFKNANHKERMIDTYYGIEGKKGGIRLVGRDELMDYSLFQMAQFIDDEILVVPRSFDIFSKLRPLPEGEFYEVNTPWDNGKQPFRHITLGKDNIVLGPNESIKYDQSGAWEALHTPLEYPYGRILALGCGKGKTVLALKHAHHRHVPTLVVCHTRQMCSAWSETAAAPWALHLPYSRHGFIGDGKIDWRGKDIVFSTMPGLVCREYPQEFWDYFGLVIFDEGDLLGATELSQVLPKFLGERILLTATIEREDGHDALYYNHVGPICYYDVTPDLSPTCLVLDSAVPAMANGEEVTKKIWWRSPSGGPVLVPHIPMTLTNIVRLFPQRRNWAMEVVKDLLDEGRKVLFLGERVLELKALDRRCKEEWPQYKSGLTLGGQHTTPQEIEHTLSTCDIIWGIQHIAKRGLNKPSIDTIVIQYACFKKEGRLRQTIGRALRYHAGKKPPLVVILNDPQIEVFDNKSRLLAMMLQQLGYEVKWHTCREEQGAYYPDMVDSLKELYGAEEEPMTGNETWEGMDEESEDTEG